jgi:hypothetical protein
MVRNAERNHRRGIGFELGNAIWSTSCENKEGSTLGGLASTSSLRVLPENVYNVAHGPKSALPPHLRR